MTIPLEKLRAVRIIVTHDNCADGRASAMILKHALPRAEVIFASYDTPEVVALPASPGMLFVDFSPPRDRVQEFVDVGTIVLDHHKTAKPVVEAFGELGVFGDEVADPGVCGAVLAMQHVWVRLWDTDEGEEWSSDVYDACSELADLAGVRDTWQRQHPRWREACAQAEALRFWPAGQLVGTAPELWFEKLMIGPVLLERRELEVRRALDTAHRTTLTDGVRLVLFEGYGLVSDAAEVVGTDADIVIAWAYRCDDGKPALACTARSHTNVDVGALAEKFGGGGHTRAAGFRLDVPAGTLNPYEHLRDVLTRFLADDR